MDWRNLVEIQSLHLTENTAKMYLACLDLSLATAQQIAKNALVNRSSAHKALAFLIENGFIEEVGDRKVKHFQVKNVQKLLELLDNKQSEIETDRQILSGLLGELMQKNHSMNISIAKIEGFEGIQTVRRDIIYENSEIFSIYNDDDLENSLDKERQLYKNYVYKKSLRAIRYSKKHKNVGFFRYKDNPQILEKRVRLGKEKFYGEIVIYGKHLDKIIFIDYLPKIHGVFIKNKKLAKNLIKLFWNTWNQ